MVWLALCVSSLSLCTAASQCTGQFCVPASLPGVLCCTPVVVEEGVCWEAVWVVCECGVWECAGEESGAVCCVALVACVIPVSV